MIKKKTKKIIRLHPELLKDIEDMCKKTSMVSRTALIEEACGILLNSYDEDT
jgi:metal-responsive CopG/Arc/MetJ family transcriptional regulator